jgi:hypothetical protein
MQNFEIKNAKMKKKLFIAIDGVVRAGDLDLRGESCWSSFAWVATSAQ